MTLEYRALKEIEALNDQIELHKEVIINLKLKEKQHDLDLLNSIKDEFIKSGQSCELVLASRIHNLESKDG